MTLAHLPRVHTIVIMLCVEFLGSASDQRVADVERKLKIVFGISFLEQMERELPGLSQQDVRKIAMGDLSKDVNTDVLIDMAADLVTEDIV